MTVFASLRIRNYRLFAAGQVVSLTGTWMQRVAQDWLVLRLSHNSGPALGFTTALQFLPLLLFGLYGGVVADRYPKRRLLIGTQSMMGLFALALGLLQLSGTVQLWHVYLLAFLLGLATVVDNPTRQAFVTELVGREHTTNAVSLNSATFNAARLLGPALAGVVITATSTGIAFLINSASFLATLLGLTLMREADLHLGPRVARAKGQLREGLGYVRRRPDLLYPIVLVGMIGTFGFNFQVTLALVARVVLHKGAGEFGLLSSALAAGSLIGALLAARRGRPRQRLLLGAALGFGLLEVVVGLMPNYLSLLLLLLPTGIVALTFSTAANSILQLGSSAAMRGRVMALYMLVFIGGTPIGAPIIGWLAGELGPRYSFIIGGAVSAATALVVGVLLARTSGTGLNGPLRRHPPLRRIRSPRRARRPAALRRWAASA